MLPEPLGFKEHLQDFPDNTVTTFLLGDVVSFGSHFGCCVSRGGGEAGETDKREVLNVIADEQDVFPLQPQLLEDFLHGCHFIYDALQASRAEVGCSLLYSWSLTPADQGNVDGVSQTLLDDDPVTGDEAIHLESLPVGTNAK